MQVQRFRCFAIEGVINCLCQPIVMCVHLGCLHCFGFRLKVCENDLESYMKYSKYYTFLRMVKFLENGEGLNC
jgi:hypothetical protein